MRIHTTEEFASEGAGEARRMRSELAGLVLSARAVARGNGEAEPTKILGPNQRYRRYGSAILPSGSEVSWLLSQPHHVFTYTRTRRTA